MVGKAATFPIEFEAAISNYRFITLSGKFVDSFSKKVTVRCMARNSLSKYRRTSRPPPAGPLVTFARIKI